LDEWGYPMVTGPVTRTLLADAREAVRACPELALHIEKKGR
jgi:ferredoxin